MRRLLRAQLNTFGAWGSGCLPLKVDVTQPDAVQSMILDLVNHFGTLHIGVNNVGGVRSARWAENVTVED